MPPELHPDIAHLSFLLGTWSGKGTGQYPTIEPFTYVEEVVISHVGKPFLSYSQKTRDGNTGLALHAEQGYFRPAGATGVELVVAQPSGITEVNEGTVTDNRISLASVTVTQTSSAKEVTTVERRLHVVEDVMTYEVDMAAVGQPLQHHLRGALHREPPTPLAPPNANIQGEPATISSVDRLKLSTLFEIRALLGTNDDERKMFERRKEICDEGFTHSYSDLFADQYDEMRPSDAPLLFEILDMFRHLQSSLDALEPSELNAQVRQSLTFGGFYSRSRREHKLSLFTQFLIRADQYSDFAEFFPDGEAATSASRRLPTYQRMLDTYKATWTDEQPSDDPLTRDQLMSIASAGSADPK